MADQQHALAHEVPDHDDEKPQLPKSAEDRKAAAALSSVSARDDDASQSVEGLDQEALGKAMKTLDIGSGPTDPNSGDAGHQKKSVKVDQADVALLVDELELSKPRALELLKAHGGDAVKTIEAFLVPFK